MNRPIYLGKRNIILNSNACSPKINKAIQGTIQFQNNRTSDHHLMEFSHRRVLSKMMEDNYVSRIFKIFETFYKVRICSVRSTIK